MLRRLADKKESIMAEKSGASSAKSFANDSKQLEDHLCKQNIIVNPVLNLLGL